MKKCKGCGVKLTKANTYVNTLRRGDKIYKILRPRCTKCHNKHEGPRSVFEEALRRYRRKSRQMGVKCDLDISFVTAVYSSACTYCTRSNQPMTLDRMNPDLGYVRENVAPACTLCNRIKSDLPWIVWQRILTVLRPAILAGELSSCFQ